MPGNRDFGVKSAASDMSEGKYLTAGIMAVVAQQEWEAISRRTREAPAAAKERGVRLGNPNGAAALRRAGQDGEALRATASGNAEQFALALAPVVEAIKADSHCTLRSIADELNKRGIATRRGGKPGSNVRALAIRLKSDQLGATEFGERFSVQRVLPTNDEILGICSVLFDPTGPWCEGSNPE